MFKVEINKEEDVIYRSGYINKTLVEKVGMPGEHTTIDYEEPFTLTITVIISFLAYRMQSVL